MNSENDIQLIKIEEFAKRLLVSRTTVFKWIKSGKLQAGHHFIRIGRCLRFFGGPEMLRSLSEHDVSVPETAPLQLQKFKPVAKSANKKTTINMNY
ncbi:MAG: helix-turn-helix domain-containing protein [Pseudomonadota bacterium]